MSRSSTLLRYTAVLASLVLCGATGAARAQAQGFTVGDWTTDSLRSEALGETRRVSVALPVGYGFKAMAEARYPVLIVFDGDYPSHDLATKIMNARSLSFMNDWLFPPMIIVGVQSTRTRVRDMSPPPVLGQPSPRPDWGGAPAFATFLADELLPWLASRYRAAPYTVVQGHSMSGLFAAWVYGQRPDKINAALAISPTLMWSDSAYAQVVRGIRQRKEPGHLFIAASEVEGTQIPGKTRQLLADLQRAPGAATTVLHQWYPVASHGQTSILGFTDGLRAIFRPVALAGLGSAQTGSAAYVAAFQRMRRSYVERAPALGLPPKLPMLFTLNQVAQLAELSEQRVLRAAVPVLCDELRASYAESWAPPLCDGFARQGAGDLDGAGAAFSEALERAQRAGDPMGMGYARQAAARLARPRQSPPKD